MQKMRDDVFENKFINVWLSLWNQTLADLQNYYNLAYESSLMGQIIFDNQLADIAKIISRDLFIKTYWQIFREQTKNGTIDAHLYILYAIFGGDATIVVENPNPLHTIFHIVTNTTSLSQWITSQGDNMVTTSGDYIKFQEIFQTISNEELIALLQATGNYGEFLEFDIAMDVDRNDYGLVTEFPVYYEDYGSVTQEPEVFADYGLITDPVQ